MGHPVAERNFTCYPLVTRAGLLIWCSHPLGAGHPLERGGRPPAGWPAAGRRSRHASAPPRRSRPPRPPRGRRAHPGVHRDPGAARVASVTRGQPDLGGGGLHRADGHDAGEAVPVTVQATNGTGSTALLAGATGRSAQHWRWRQPAPRHQRAGRADRPRGAAGGHRAHRGWPAASPAADATADGLAAASRRTGPTGPPAATASRTSTGAGRHPGPARSSSALLHRGRGHAGHPCPGLRRPLDGGAMDIRLRRHRGAAAGTTPTARRRPGPARWRIEIPVLDVSAPVTLLGLASNGTVQVPPLADHNLAGWYDRSVTPGQRGARSSWGTSTAFTGISGFFVPQDAAPGGPDRRAAGRRLDRRLHRGRCAEGGQGNVPQCRCLRPGRLAQRARSPAADRSTSGRQYLDNIVVYAHRSAAPSDRGRDRRAGGAGWRPVLAGSRTAAGLRRVDAQRVDPAGRDPALAQVRPAGPA